ncbi:hypothetical protein PGB90_007217 [Kerria lacca]
MDDNPTERILNFVRNFPNGVSDKDIQKEIPEIDVQKRVEILNSLVRQNSIGIYKQSGGKIIYKANVTSDPEDLRSADNEEKLVYRIIKEAGNKGVWIRDIRKECNLLRKQLEKTLRSLENKKLIKSIKTVSAPKKKFYILYEIEPDPSLTGGAWYSDQDFESEFVDRLNELCYKFLLAKKEQTKDLIGDPILVSNNLYASAAEVCTFINKCNISKILTTLIYDEKVSKKLAAGGSYLYKAVDHLLASPGLSRNPCGVCPVYRKCEIGCAVNPKTCSYLNEWLM